ncbi:hypothetical protein GQ53DRAFT_729956 [Thozetella sp. PMI_491]|nr:hypothetical protein GQ53DRAFT_729956 [Thozetella sp. PMI_491]
MGHNQPSRPGTRREIESTDLIGSDEGVHRAPNITATAEFLQPRANTEPGDDLASSASPWLDELRWILDRSGSSIQPTRSRKRDRAIISCARCRKHKVRCDRKSPCGRCRKLGKQSECVYSAPTSSPQKYILLEDDLTLSSVASNNPRHMKDLRFRNKAHWTSIYHELVNYLPQHLREILERDEPENGNSEYTNSVVPSFNYPFGIKTENEDDFPEDLSQLLPQSQQQLFLSYYMSTIEETYHLVDLASFETKLHAFWASKSTADDDWLAQYFVILSLGCQAFLSIQDDYDETYRNLPTRLLYAAEHHLKRTPFLFNPSLGNIRTLCLIVIAKQLYAMSCHETDACWHLTGMLVRLSIVKGLHIHHPHRDKEKSCDNQSEARLWATIMSLDMKQSSVCGLPLFLRSSDISSLKPESTTSGSTTHQAKVAGSGMNNTTIFQDILVDCGGLLLEAMELTNRHDDSVAYAQVVELDTALRARLKVLQSMEKRRGATDLEICAADIFFRKILMSLHSRFALQPISSTKYPTSYVSSLEGALSILSRQRQLCEVVRQEQPISWFVGFFRYEFFTAALTLCYHLARSDDLPSLPLASGFERHPREIMLDALQLCRELWAREKQISVCSENAFGFLDQVVRALRI